MYGICNLAIVPMRQEPNDRSEQVSQILFGETFEIVEQNQKWSKIKLHFDGYEGWIDSKQLKKIDAQNYQTLANEPLILNGDLLEYVASQKSLLPITLGAELNFLHFPEINTQNFEFDGLKKSGIHPKANLIQTSFLYLNAPYLWGGKSPLGIDCSGFTQMVYKLNGYVLPRDASQQALVGESLSFIEECEPGDLAFFDNEEGKIIHVGIMLPDYHIIHASGQVRIDSIDHQGIFNADLNQHTHKLRVLKKII
uniref:C40 family peptidase n=1 Tax=Flavobacterium sp. TaxID=239 RepID=UPI00404AD985